MMRAAAAALAIAQPQYGLIDNVTGYTLDDHGALRRFSGLLIDSNGKVAQLLNPGDKTPGSLTFRLDANRKVLIPGLADAHGHVMALGLRAMRVDFVGVTSLTQMQARLSVWAGSHSAPKWITGYGVDPAAMGMTHMPTAADLDVIAGDRPVWLIRADGAAGVANSAALTEAGITSATSAPPDGRIERGGNGRPDGVLYGSAMGLIERAIPSPLPVEREAALAKAQDLLLAAGLTSVTDIGTTVDDWMAFRRAGDAGRLRLRIIAYADGVDPLLTIAGTGPTPWLYDGRLRMVGVSLDDDDILEGGTTRIGDARLRNLMSRAAMDGFQVSVDAEGSSATSQVVGAIAELAQTYDGERRWRIDRIRPIDPANAAGVDKLQIITVTQPVRFPAGLGASAPGPRIAYGSEFPIASPNPFAGIAAAMTAASVPAQTAITGFSTSAAYAGRAEDKIGSLMPGRWADFLLIDRDIFRLQAADIAGTRVLESWISGKRAWVNPSANQPYPLPSQVNQQGLGYELR
jgi:predicted amidohydrolase YtcJ